MNRKQKQIARFHNMPSDFQFDEMVKLPGDFDFEEVKEGKNPEPRVKF